MISIASLAHANNTLHSENYFTYNNVSQFEKTIENANFSNGTFQNDTFTEYPEIPYYIKATSMTFCIVIMCLGVIGNVMVPIVILKTKDMRNSTNIFLVNLSIADLMVLLVCTPTVLVEVNSKPETWVLGKELCLAVPFVELTVAHASVLTILAISFERYYAICEPLRAGYVCTKTRATLICGLAWFFAALFTSPILAIADHHAVSRLEGTSYQCLTQAASFWQITFFIIIIFLLYIIPLIILIILYTIIAKNLINAASKVVMNKTVDPCNTRARKQVILMLGTVVLCFFLCLMPYRILALWIIITPSEIASEMSPEKWYNILYFSRIMLYINSAINPILYNLMSSKFRLGFCKVCICYKKSSERIQNRRVNRLVTNGSTTSSSLTRTTNSLKKLFHHRSSVDKSEVETENRDVRDDKVNLFDRIFNSKRFVRQQSAPVCSNTKPKMNRMRSEGNVFEEVNDIEKTEDIHSNNKIKTDFDVDTLRRNKGSLRRSVLINTAKAKSVEYDNSKIYDNVEVDCVKFHKAKSVEYDFPESFVPILGVATFTYEHYEGGTEVPVCLTQADTFWSALFFIFTIAVFFIIPLAVLLVLYSVIAKNLMENPVIISQHSSKSSTNAGNVLKYRKQVILMLGTVVLSFFVCLLPFKALTLWIIVFPPETIMSLGLDGYYILLYFCRVMLYLNSAINPILYNLMSSKFRDGFVKLLRINKLMKCRKNFRDSMQRRDTFNTTTSTGFSSSQNNSESFWRRYSNRASSLKNVVKRESKKAKEVKEILEVNSPLQPKIVEIINVENRRRNSMKFIAELNDKLDGVGDIINDNRRGNDNRQDDDNINIKKDDNKESCLVEIHNDNDVADLDEENNKQIQILNLDVKTNNVYSITLDISEGNNKFVCVPNPEREKSIFVYDITKESFV